MAESSETGLLASLDEAAEGSKKRRRPITDVQRKDLRVHKRVLIQRNGKWSLKEMIDFFNDKYHRVLHKSTISESLSDTFKHLDEQYHPSHPDSKRRHESKWPDLEAVLFDWEQRASKSNRTITNDDLKDMAKKFFDRLPQYHNEDAPGFSNYWLDNYKTRYEVKKSNDYGKSDATNRETVQQLGLKSLHETLARYKNEDIYSMDEAALCWKMIPEHTPAVQRKAGRKQIKAQVTVILACNATDTRRLPPWIIGKAQTPRCFDSSGVQVRNLPIIWRYNGEALMTGVMFEEYVQWFDAQMAGRQVYLLVDNLSTHLTGMGLLNWEHSVGLSNTKVLFLPSSTPSSSCQPFDQGIIRSWKAHYRRRWLAYMQEYMQDEYDAHRDPMKTMNVLQAIRWIVAAWHHDVTPTTIQSSWIKSGIVRPKPDASATERWQNYLYEDNQIFNQIMSGLEQRIQSFVRQSRIRSPMAVTTFVNPPCEAVDDDDDNDEENQDGDYHFESLLEAYSTGGAMRDHETDEEDIDIDLVEESEALDLLSRLRLYEEQQDDADKALISRLNEYEKDIQARLSP